MENKVDLNELKEVIKALSLTSKQKSILLGYIEDTVDDIIGKIADVIGEAPEALDTLQELAAALDNDENFAATVVKKLDEVKETIDNLDIEVPLANTETDGIVSLPIALINDLYAAKPNKGMYFPIVYKNGKHYVFIPVSDNTNGGIGKATPKSGVTSDAKLFDITINAYGAYNVHIPYVSNDVYGITKGHSNQSPIEDLQNLVVKYPLVQHNNELGLLRAIVPIASTDNHGVIKLGYDNTDSPNTFALKVTEDDYHRGYIEVPNATKTSAGIIGRQLAKVDRLNYSDVELIDLIDAYNNLIDDLKNAGIMASE